jgi:CRISPR-associated protein Csx16
MSTYFVTRHPGAVEWATKNGFAGVDVVNHFDPKVVNVGDKVIGNLPVDLAAVVCRRGGEYHHLVLDLPPEARGKELSAEDMDAYGAKVQRFDVIDL